MDVWLGDERAARLAGDRLLLRDFRAGDLETVHSYAGNPAVTRFLDWGPNGIEETRAFLDRAIAQRTTRERRNFDVAVVHAQSGALIGGAALTVTGEHGRGEIGYVLHPDFWSNGYATEAARILLRFGFDQLHLHRISATCDPANIASAAVLRKAGLRFEGRMREHMLVRGVWRDSLLFAAIEV